MPARRKHPDELRERAVEMVLEIRAREGKGHGELARVGRRLGVHPGALRGWVRQGEIDGGAASSPAELVEELIRRGGEQLAAPATKSKYPLDPRRPR